MKKTLTKIAALAALALSTAAPGARAQNSTVSPYSRFGYGLLSEQANTAQASMGGVGLAMRSGRSINAMNPASYAAIDSLTFLFDMGLNLQALHTSESVAGSKLSGNDLSGGLNYITMQVPLCKWAGASAGLMPYSEVGYSFGDEIANGTNSRSGSGGFNQLYLGLSAKPFKGFTLGVNASYLFGTSINDVYVNTDNNSQSLFERTITLRDYKLRFGLQYGFHIGADNEVTLGVVYEPQKSFHGRTEGIKYDVNLDTTPDTIANLSLKGRATMPALYGAGINWTWQGRLMVEADFTYQQWKGAKFARIEGFDNIDGFDNRWRASIGAEYTHRPRGNYAQRINWRIGAYYCNDYLKINNNGVSERGISIGAGLPTPLAKTIINLSLDYRHRQAHPNPLVKEDYLVVTLGVNFNELWFWRNKIR